MKKNTNNSRREMIEKVDRFLESFGLNDEMVSIKNKDDKILYYYNHVDENNDFNGDADFPSKYLIDMINLLCKEESAKQTYLRDFYDINNVNDSVMNFKSYIKQTRENENKIKLKIQDNMHHMDFDRLYLNLQELFLEPFDEYYIKKLYKMIEKGLNVNDIFAWYGSEYSFVNMFNFKLEHIKENTKKIKAA